MVRMLRLGSCLALVPATSTGDSQSAKQSMIEKSLPPDFLTRYSCIYALQNGTSTQCKPPPQCTTSRHEIGGGEAESPEKAVLKGESPAAHSPSQALCCLVTVRRGPEKLV